MVKVGGLSILVGLKDLSFCPKISKTAARLGIQAHFASRAKEFWDKAHEILPSLIILDLGAAALDPLDLVLALKLDPVLHEVPVLGYAAQVGGEIRAKALAAGCEEVLVRTTFSRQLPALLGKYAAVAWRGSEGRPLG